MFASTPAELRARTNTLLPALTVEAFLYLTLASLALFLRLFLLDLTPLNSVEAGQAVAAWNFVRGAEVASTGSPLLFSLSAVFFTLFGASEITARLTPAFFGTVLVLLPYLFRRDLGRGSALIAGVLLAFSPALVFFSRTVEGAIPAVTLALAAIGLGLRYLELQTPRDLFLGAACAALALLSGAEIWTIVLALVILIGMQRARMVMIPRPAQNYPDNRMRNAGIVFLLTFLGTATTFLLHREGIGAAFELLNKWLASLRPGSSLVDTVRLLVVYEPTVFLFGAVALFDLLLDNRERKKSFIFVLLGIWSATAFVLLALTADNNPARIVTLVVPLALLAASVIGEWVERIAEWLRVLGTREILSHETPILAVAGVLTSFLAIVLAELALRGHLLTTDAVVRVLGVGRDNPALGGTIVAMLFLIAFGAAAVLALTTLGADRARNVGIVFLLALLSMWTFRQTTMLNFPGEGGLNAREWMVARAGSSNLRDLVRDLENASRWRARDTHTLTISADAALGPLVEWNLRKFRSARLASRPTPSTGIQAIILPSTAPAPAEGWIGQRYKIEETRSNQFSPHWLRATLYRDVGGIIGTDVVVWIPKP